MDKNQEVKNNRLLQVMRELEILSSLCNSVGGITAADYSRQYLLISSLLPVRSSAIDAPRMVLCELCGENLNPSVTTEGGGGAANCLYVGF